MNLKLKRTPGIYLVGFMAAGKSTVGRALARRLGWRFVDLDEEIEAAERTSVADLFERRGEAEFRRIEAAILLREVSHIECGSPAVVALGGGAFAEPGNRDLIGNNGVTVWLDCPFETVRRRVGPAPERPLARDPVRFAALYEARLPGYRLAHLRVTIDSDDAEAVAVLILQDPQLR